MGAVILDREALMNMVWTLRDVLPLEILPEEDRGDLVRDMRVRRFRADEIIYHQGDPAADAHIVFTGLVKVMLLNHDGHQALIALHARGDLFGELALLTEASRESTVVAVTPTTVLQLQRDACWRVLNRNAGARDWFFQHLASRIGRIEQKYQAIVFLDVPARLAKCLLELDHIGRDLPITQDDIAAAIGSSRVTVNKLLAEFDRRGLIRAQRGIVDIIDHVGLQRETVR